MWIFFSYAEWSTTRVWTLLCFPSPVIIAMNENKKIWKKKFIFFFWCYFHSRYHRYKYWVSQFFLPCIITFAENAHLFPFDSSVIFSKKCVFFSTRDPLADLINFSSFYHFFFDSFNFFIAILRFFLFLRANNGRKTIARSAIDGGKLFFFPFSGGDLSEK